MTAPNTTTDILESLDWQHSCQAIDYHLIGWTECGQPATWLYVLPCCGHQCFTCNWHHEHASDNPSACSACSTNYSTTYSFRKYKI